jgi:hypothetical protein
LFTSKWIWLFKALKKLIYDVLLIVTPEFKIKINLRTNLIPLLDERADTILRRIKVYVNRITDKDERDKFIIDMKNVNVEIGDTEC